jgi:hypothetical protein
MAEQNSSSELSGLLAPTSAAVSKRELMLFVLLNHWGEYDYSGTEVVGIYRDRNDAETKKARLEIAHIVDITSDEYATPCFYTIEEKRAVI